MKKINFIKLYTILITIISFSFIQFEIKSQNLNKKNKIEVKLTFDGIWLGPGNITLIKQFSGYVIFQGNDKVSSWSARGIIKGNQLICRGYGVTNTNKHFVYESIMTLKSNILEDKWKATFMDGEILEGKDDLKLIKPDELKKKLQESR